MEERVVEAIQPVFTVFGLGIYQPVVITWFVMAFLVIMALLLTRKLEMIPKKPQMIAETVVGFVNDFIKQLIGHHWRPFAPYLGTIALYLLFANTIGMFGLGFLGLQPPTRDLSVTAALALMTIVLVIGSSIRYRGFKTWVKHLFKPMWFMVFFNILDYFTRPLSLCMRLFGNIFAGFVIMEMVEKVIYLHVGLAVAFSMYFDLFDGLIQMVVFVFLSSIYIREAIE